MTNTFLKINKDLFKLKLEPVEILILAQVIEYNTNTGDCFISNETLAEQFGTSTSTIDRKIKSLESRGYISRETKNVKGGKVRHMKVKLNNIEAALTNLNLTLVESNNSTNSKMMIDKPQNDTCANVNLTLVKPQIDVIKDNIKDNIIEKEKENTGIDACASIPMNLPEEEIEIDGIKAKRMSTDEATEKFGWTSCMNRIPTAIPKVFWINKELVQIV